MRVVSMTRRPTLFLAMATHAKFQFGAAEMAGERYFLARKSSERTRGDVDNVLTSTTPKVITLFLLLFLLL